MPPPAAAKLVPEEPTAATEPGASRILLQRLAPATIRRHFTHAVTRVVVLLGADWLTYGALYFLIVSLNETPLGGRFFAPLWGSIPQHFPGGIHFGFAMVLGLMVSGAYGRGDYRKDGTRILTGILLATALTFWGSFWLFPPGAVAISFVLTLVFVTTAVYIARNLLDHLVTTSALTVGSREKAVFIGRPSAPMFQEIEERFLEGTRMDSLGWVTPTTAYSMEYQGEEGEIWDILHSLDADTVILCGEFPPKQFADILEAAATSGCRILSPSRYGHLVGTRLSWYRGAPVMELTLPVLRGQQMIIKRMIDVCASLGGLIALSPLMAYIALRIKLDSPGPVFFKQERVGFGGNIFRMIKFRTMSATADDEKQELAHLNETGDPRLFKIENDPRVTEFGAWLRAWSLDELPQLWNVLRGDMSLVGPRPFFESDLVDYRDHHFDRLAAKPGITGLWQVNGRSEVQDFEEVVRLDREYVSRWSLRLDLHILMRTLPAVMTRKGAY